MKKIIIKAILISVALLFLVPTVAYSASRISLPLSQRDALDNVIGEAVGLVKMDVKNDLTFKYKLNAERLQPNTCYDFILVDGRLRQIYRDMPWRLPDYPWWPVDCVKQNIKTNGRGQLKAEGSYKGNFLQNYPGFNEVWIVPSDVVGTITYTDYLGNLKTVDALLEYNPSEFLISQGMF